MPNKAKANVKVKDTLFRFIFSDPEALLELYNAINHSNYTDSSELEITTLENVIYMNMKNDISFLISQEMNLYEHQSTMNPNMPLRGLFYFSSLYRQFVQKRGLDIYGSRRLSLPFPRFIVFYNGEGKMDEQMELRLSDSFEIPAEQNAHGCALECTALVLNINYGHNRALMDACRKLKEYAIFIGKIREFRAQGFSHTAAVDMAIDHCIRQDVLKDILEIHREEARLMILEEYDPEFHMRKEKELSFEEGQTIGLSKGREEGREEGICISCKNLMKEMGISCDKALGLIGVPLELRAQVKEKIGIE